MARNRPAFPTRPIPAELLASPGFLVAWLADHLTEGYDRAMEELDLRSTHHATLVSLAAGGPLRQARLEDRLRVDHATFVASLTELERRGLVDRVPDPGDRRTLVVELTSAGRALVEQTRTAVTALEDAAFGALSADERAALTALLARVAATLEQDGPPVG